MAGAWQKHVKSKYYGVNGEKSGSKTYWYSNLKGCDSRRKENEIEVAKLVDIFLIRQGKEPRNILKRKNDDLQGN